MARVCAPHALALSILFLVAGAVATTAIYAAYLVLRWLLEDPVIKGKQDRPTERTSGTTKAGTAIERDEEVQFERWRKAEERE
jgi:hypothetical protein